MIAPNIIIPFDGNHADVPSGWTRETTLDSKYIKGTANATNPNTTGGAATHTHTSPEHTHTISAHSHTIVTSSNNHTNSANQSTSNSGTPRECGRDEHTHSGTITTQASASIQNVSVTYSSYSNDPAYYTVIFIKASSYTTIPNNAMVFSASTTRSGLTFHTASANKFLKGAGTGANAGGTGGSTTNTHTITHTHTAAHGHTGNSGGPSTASSIRSSSGSLLNAVDHTHTITLNTTTLTSGNNSSIGNQAETVQPAYTTLNAFKNTSGSSKMPAVGDIALWLGTLATIPVGWKLCDGTNDTPDMRGRYYKNNASATTSSTGGANTHTHTAQGHTHTIESHTHSGSVATAANNKGIVSGGASSWQAAGGSHSLSSISSTSTSLASGNTSANSSSNEPEYRTVAFIQFEFSASGGAAFLFTLIDQTDTLPSFD